MAAIGTLVAADLAGANLAGISQGEMLLMERPYMRPKYLSYNFDLPVLLIASFIFLMILMWFDCMRLTIEYAFVNTQTTHSIVLSYLTFSLTITAIFILVIFLIMKYWIKYF